MREGGGHSNDCHTVASPALAADPPQSIFVLIRLVVTSCCHVFPIDTIMSDTATRPVGRPFFAVGLSFFVIPPASSMGITSIWSLIPFPSDMACDFFYMREAGRYTQFIQRPREGGPTEGECHSPGSHRRVQLM